MTKQTLQGKECLFSKWINWLPACKSKWILTPTLMPHTHKKNHLWVDYRNKCERKNNKDTSEKKTRTFSWSWCRQSFLKYDTKVLNIKETIKWTTLKLRISVHHKYHKESENANLRGKDICKAYAYQRISIQIIKTLTNQ